MKLLSIILLVLIGVSSAGCTDLAVVNTITPTVTPPSETDLPTQTLSPSPIVTSIPTLAEENAYPQLIELVQNNADCSLPCLWGITPGISSVSEVLNLLIPFTGVAKFSDLPISVVGGMIFEIPLQDDSHLSLFLSYFPGSENQGINAIYLSTQAFHNDGDPALDQSFYGSVQYAEILNNYTLPSILSTYGVPAEVLIFIEPSIPKYFNLRLLYPRNGIFISYGTFVEEQGENYLGCPTNMFISLYLLSPEASANYQEVLPMIGPDFQNVYPVSDFKPLEEVTNISLEDFYQMFKNPTNICLVTPKAIWWP